MSSAMLAAALFVPRIAEGLYWGLDREPPPALNLLAALWLFMSVTAWFWGYCRAHRVHWPIDMGWFLMLAWVVVVPYCIIGRERWRGVLRIAFFVLASLAAVAAEWATAVVIHAMVGGP